MEARVTQAKTVLLPRRKPARQQVDIISEKTAGKISSYRPYCNTRDNRIKAGKRGNYREKAGGFCLNLGGKPVPGGQAVIDGSYQITAADHLGYFSGASAVRFIAGSPAAAVNVNYGRYGPGGGPGVVNIQFEGDIIGITVGDIFLHRTQFRPVRAGQGRRGHGRYSCGWEG